MALVLDEYGQRLWLSHDLKIVAWANRREIEDETARLENEVFQGYNVRQGRLSCPALLYCWRL